MIMSPFEGDNNVVNGMQYTNKHFLRTHSKGNDGADVQTQVWKAAFEPNFGTQDSYTNIVATCGGNSICLINVQTGTVVQKFNSNEGDIFNDVTWGRYNSKNILAAAGNTRFVYLICPTDSKVFNSTLKSFKARKVFITSLLFHPQEEGVLFCGRSTGEIVITRILSEKNAGLEFIHCILHARDCTILQMAFSQPCHTLLTASEGGLKAWPLRADFLESKRIEEYAIEISPPPGFDSNCETNQIFDTVVVLGSQSSIVASKRALDGHIVVWDLADTLEDMNQKTEKLLACGDDKGCIWVYNLEAVLKNSNLGELSTQSTPLEPSCKIPWPKNLRDQWVAKKRKLDLDVYDIVIANVAMSEGFVVAVTNNNLVCIWERQQSTY
ncbi:hypothetical protein B566_EDAN004374 [Ephemera danica]|nr:hypothetical protein B566_EDAN004374 [Ephemera danica]